MVEIFKTNVEETEKAVQITEILRKRFPTCRFNFDLSDCDRILRAESYNGSIDIEGIVEIAKKYSLEIKLIKE